MVRNAGNKDNETSHKSIEDYVEVHPFTREEVEAGAENVDTAALHEALARVEEAMDDGAVQGAESHYDFDASVHDDEHDRVAFFADGVRRMAINEGIDQEQTSRELIDAVTALHEGVARKIGLDKSQPVLFAVTRTEEE